MNSKLIAIAFVAGLAGCSSTATQQAPGKTGGSSTPSQPSPSAASPAGGGNCDASAVQAMAAQAKAGAASLRIIEPGQVMTMEYNPTRLTVVVDEAKSIASVRCG